MKTVTENKINALFEELVPMSGKADTVAGEVIRAVCRIAYRNWNDGDHIGVDYGNETCNPAARYLMQNTDAEIENIIIEMWGVYSDDEYDKYVEKLEKAVLDFIEANPELKTKENNVDMWDFRVDEDYEYEEEDEEDYY